MRPLELTLTLVLALFAGWNLILAGRLGRVRDFLGVGLVPLAVAQVVVEGYRWQLVPVWVAVFVAVSVAVWDLARPSAQPERWRLGGPIAALFAVAVVAAPAVLVPIPQLPVPGGPYAVGTISTVLTDVGRAEMYGSRPGGPRELVLQVWYPAAPEDGAATGPWIDHLEEIGPELSAVFGFPRFALDHARYIETHSFPQSDPAESGPWPVVVYAHGWTGFRANALHQMESLASEGYIVAAVDHTYGSAATRFPDGRVVKRDVAALPEFGSVPDDAYDAAALELVATYAADLRFVVDSLKRFNHDAGWLLHGQLDLDHLGVFGHSTGGGAALAFCEVDERCGAVLGLDPWVEPVDPAILEGEITVPFLAVRSEVWLDYENDSVLQEIARSGAKVDLIAIRGSGHQDFTMLPMFSPLAKTFGAKGPIASDRVNEIVDWLLVGFFDGHLNGGPEMVAAPFQEVCEGSC